MLAWPLLCAAVVLSLFLSSVLALSPLCPADGVCAGGRYGASARITLSLRLESVRALRTEVKPLAADVPELYRADIEAVVAGVPEGGAQRQSYIVIVGGEALDEPPLQVALVGTELTVSAPEAVALIPWSEPNEALVLATLREHGRLDAALLAALRGEAGATTARR